MKKNIFVGNDSALMRMGVGGIIKKKERVNIPNHQENENENYFESSSYTHQNG